jgi:predicted transposase/invertase (TIGR01784 family)
VVIFYKKFRRLSTYSSIFTEDVFTQAFEKAEIAKFGQAELDNYENSLKVYRDLKGVIDTAFDDGKNERSSEIAKQLKNNGVDIEIISKSTGLTKEEIEKL